MKVLLVVIDAASPRVVCPAIQTGRLRHLKRLADYGEMHQASTTIFPSITPAATTSILTGSYPAEHGIAGASWFEEARNEVVYYGDDFWVIAKEGFGAFLRDFLVRLNGDRLTAPTMFELVERTGRRAACLNYLVYRGLVTHDVKVPWLLAMLPGVPLTETVDGPSILHLGDFVAETPLRHSHHDGKGGLLHRFGMDDAATAALLTRMAEQGQWPDLTVAYFADNDYRSHEVGPHAALPTIDRVDAALGEMFEAAGGFERLMRDVCVIVTSDHGHSEILPEREEAVVELQTVLGDFPHAELGRPWRPHDEIMICPNMRAAQIYVRHPRNIERIAQTALLDPRVDLVMWRSATVDADAPGYTVVGQRGRLVFWREAGGAGQRGMRSEDAFGTRWSWIGEPETLQLLPDGRFVESTEYPNAFERIANALEARNSGEVWVTVEPGREFDVPGGHAHVGGGSHGALHALDSLSPVVAAGLGRRLPRAMRSVDIAPLCLQALGMSMRYEVESPRPAGSASALARRAPADKPRHSVYWRTP